MPKTYDVAGIGNAIVGMFAPVDDAFLLDHKIAKGVMTLIDEFRAAQLFQAFGDTREIAGGSAANTMVGIASFGGKGLFVGKVKDDRLGQSFAASLKEPARITRRVRQGRSRNGLLPDRCDARRPAQHEHIFGREPRTQAGRYRRRCDGPGPSPLHRRLSMGRAGIESRDHQGDDATKKAGGKVALTLSDPFCVGRNREEFLELYKTQRRRAVRE